MSLLNDVQKFIEAHPGCTSGDIADAFAGYSRQRVLQSASKLRQSGRVAHRCEGDTRRHFPRLTERAQEPEPQPVRETRPARNFYVGTNDPRVILCLTRQAEELESRGLYRRAATVWMAAFRESHSQPERNNFLARRESWLARHAAMKRCPRKGATAASGYMRWEGVSDGLKVTAGSVIQRDDLVQYTATADATSSGGVLRVPIACSSAGAVGNADDGTSLILVTPVNGLPSSGVADTLTGGFDTEELETWRARVIERYYWTPQGGADGDYVVWAKEVPGITRAWTYRHWMGTGTVGVMIASSDLINPIPEESTETAARQHIEPLAPVAGSDLYVFRPVAHKVDFHIRVTPDTPEIRTAITAELRSFLLRDGYPQGELKVSRISEAISGANGEYSHQLLAPADNISIAKNELAVLGTISWT